MLERERNFKEIDVRIIPLLASLCFLPQSFAATSVHELIKEYLQNNSDLAKSRSSATLSRYDFLNTKDQYGWSLAWNTDYSDDAKESAPFFNSNPLKSISHTASLTKDFNWGGKFSLDNTFTSLRGTNSFGGLNGRVRGFTQGVTYSQDLGANFLGRSNRLEIVNAEENYKFSKVSSDETVELGLLSFYSSYVDIKLKQSLVQLQKEAFDRSIKRRKLIARRVRDGLREKVDLFQSQLTEMTQGEQVKSAKMNLSSSLENLSKFLHREIGEEEVSAFDLKQNSKPEIPIGDWKGNKNLLKLDQQVTYLKGVSKNSDYSIMPSLNLSASYASNDFDVETSNALENGLVGGVNNEVGVALTMSWPIGFETQRNAKAKANVNLTTAEMERKKLRINVDQIERSLKKQIELLDNNIQSVQQRVDLASKALAEYNRLYNRGKADLDQVIRAEEDLIGTQRSFVEYLAQREGLLVSLAQLYGNLESYLLEVR